MLLFLNLLKLHLGSTITLALLLLCQIESFLALHSSLEISGKVVLVLYLYSSVIYRVGIQYTTTNIPGVFEKLLRMSCIIQNISQSIKNLLMTFFFKFKMIS